MRRSGGTGPAVVLIVALAAVTAASALGGTVTDGVVSTLPASRVLHLMCVVATVGVLVVRGWAWDPGHRTLLAGAARSWAVLALVATSGWTVLTASEVTGPPLADDLVRTQLAACALALVVTVLATTASRVVLGALVTAALAVAVLPAAASHVGDQGQWALPTASLVVHVGAAAVWAGTVLAVVVHLRSRPALLARCVPNLRRVTTCCVIAVVVSGVASSAAAGVLPAADGSAYGRLLGVKVLLLAGVLAVGAYQHRVAAPAATTGQPRALLDLAVVELSLLTTTFAAASVLALNEPPWA